MTKEVTRKPAHGGMMLVVNIVIDLFALALIISGAEAELVAPLITGVALLLLGVFMSFGFFIVAPNQAAVLLFFGKYVGSVKTNGFYWVNPFTIRKRISLRARNLNGQKLKVNDRGGNPIEIAAVLVWEVKNTAEAMFDVDDYEGYVDTQSESAVRHLATSYSYDNREDSEEPSLRGDIDRVSKQLESELSERLARAGVRVIEARLSHLAYAPEIAGAMLQRQQADAIIAARAKIVEGAVGMVEDALRHLSERGVVDLDPERKANMVSNLLVVLCGQHDAQPILNAGSLY
ncbi:MAG: membrane protein [Gemmatimonadota bacterium]|nr:MAG: membrane protein [Gemmatimonadota bacterium]